MTDREKHISVLQDIDRAYRTFTQEEYRALEYAIASLKTDEAYQLMYEGEDIYTKADMVAILTDIQFEIGKLESKHINDRYDDGFQANKIRVKDIIQQKIKKLRGEESGNGD